MPTLLARFRCVRQLVSLLMMSSGFFLSACFDNHYRPEPLPRPNFYEGTSASDRAGGRTAAPASAAQEMPAGVASAVATSSAVKVGLLLPQTGRHAVLGRALYDAATMAVFDKYANLSPQKLSTRVELIAFDTGDNVDQARSAAQDALKANVAMIIGPVFSDMTEVVAEVLKDTTIPVVSFTNNLSVARPNVYAFGFSPEQQTARVIDYTVRGGKMRLGALIPQTPYGDLVLSTMKKTLQSHDLPLSKTGRYLAQGGGIEEAVNAVLPRGKPASIDAIFLPEAGEMLETIVRSLDGRTPERIGLIGTGLWDDTSLINKVNLQGAWLATTSPTLTRAFEKRFAATYRYQPPRIASLAYDAASLAVILATSGRGFSPAVLTHPGGFTGPANGIFRFLKNGASERGLAIVLVQGGGFIVLDPAPVSFTQTR